MKHTIGIVGAGVITGTMHLPVLTSMPGVEVAWLTDRDGARADALAASYAVASAPLPADPRDLPACDAVLLAIPPRPRTSYYEALAARGTAVMAEKPVATSSEEHRRLLGLFPAHRLACGFQRRTYATTRIAQRLLDGGWLGGLRTLTIREGDRTKKTGADRTHLDDPELAGGGVLISVGCHSLDWALFVTRAEDYEILSTDIVYDGSLDRKVSARIRLRGASASFDLDYVVSWLDPQPNAIELCFDGAKVSCGVGPGTELELSGSGASRPEATLVSRVPGAVTANQACFLEWRAFLDGLERGAPSEMSAESALLTTRLIEDLYRQGRSA